MRLLPDTSPAKRASLFGPWSSRPKRILWLLVCAGMLVWRGPATVKVLQPPPDLPLDFFQEWAGARNYLEGLPLYTSQDVSLRNYLGLPDEAAKTALIQVNAHPPTTALVVLPLARLSYQNGALIFNLLTVPLLFGSLWLVVRTLKTGFTWWDALPTLSLLLLSNPLRQQLTQGQWNLPILALITLGWALARRGHDVAAGASIGLAASLKPFPAFLMVYFAARGNWRAVAASAASFAVTTALSALVFGPDVWVIYVRDVMPKVAPWRSSWINASLPGFWSKLLNPLGTGGAIVPIARHETLAWLLTGASCVIVLAIVAVRANRAGTRGQRDWAFALATVGMLLVWPLTWPHSFLLLLTPAVLLWMVRPVLAPYRLAAIACMALLWTGEDWFWYALIGTRWFEPVVAKPWQTLTALSVHFYALLGLFVTCMLASGTARPDPSLDRV